MTVSELKNVTSWAIEATFTYFDKYTNEEYDWNKMTARERREFLQKNIYMLFRGENGTIRVSLY